MAHRTGARDGEPPDETLGVKHVSAEHLPRPGTPLQNVATDAAVVIVGNDLIFSRTLHFI